MSRGTAYLMISYAPSENSDQSAHVRNLTIVFAGLFGYLAVAKYSKRLQVDSEDQAVNTQYSRVVPRLI